VTVVVDASVLVASFAVNESHHKTAFRLLRSVIPENIGLVVPATFVVEVTAGLARKLAAHAIEPEEADQGIRYARSARFQRVAVDDASPSAPRPSRGRCGSKDMTLYMRP
jgi:predicted nucleic acid-binding protein